MLTRNLCPSSGPVLETNVPTDAKDMDQDPSFENRAQAR